MQPGAVYTLDAELYAEALSECDSGAAVTWCSPSIVVCPGKYQPTFYETGGCYVGLAPTGKDKWEQLSGTFLAKDTAATVYINQESTKYDSLLDNVRMQKFGSAVLSCTSGWAVHNSEVMCDEIGGQTNVLRLKDAG